MTKLIKKLSEPKTLLFVALCYTIFVSVGLLAPMEGLSQPKDVPLDKAAHFCIHLLLVLLWLFVFFVRKNFQWNLKHLLLIIGVCVLYGIVIEVLQTVLGFGRQADILDILANSCGTLIGFVIFQKTKHFFKGNL